MATILFGTHQIEVSQEVARTLRDDLGTFTRGDDPLEVERFVLTSIRDAKTGAYITFALPPTQPVVIIESPEPTGDHAYVV